MTDAHPLSLRDVIRVLFKHKRLILGMTGAALVTSAIVAFLTPPTYEATTHLLVRRSNSEPEDPTILQSNRAGSTVMRQVSQADEVHTEIAIVSSRDLVQRVIEDAGLTRESFERVVDFRRYVRATYRWVRDTWRVVVDETKYFLHLSRRPTPEAAAEHRREVFLSDVARALVAEQVPDSDVVRVGFRCSDPTLAKQLASTIGELAISWHIDKYRQSGNVSFFQEQADRAREQIEQTERELAEKRGRLNLVGIEERKRLLVESRFRARSRHNDVLARKASTDAGIRKLQETIAAEPTMVTVSKQTSASPVRQLVSERAAELEMKRAEAVGKFAAGARTVKDMDAALQGWREQLEKLPASREDSTVVGVNTVLQALRQQMLVLSAERAALAAEAGELQKQMADYDAELTSLNDHEFHIKDLERRRESQASTYAQFMNNLEMARTFDAKQRARIGNVAIIQTAALPLQPVKPRKWLLILASAGGALLLAIAWAFAAELNDTAFENEAAIRNELGVDVLGTIPKTSWKRSGAPSRDGTPRAAA